MIKPFIIVKDLVVKSQDSTVFDGISFSLQPGEHLALLGDSDSGKTTLANAIAGKIHFEGSIAINSDDITGPHTRIQLIEQRYNFKNLSGISDFYYQQRYNSFDSNDAPTVYEELLKASPKDSEPTIPIGRQANIIDFTLAILGIEYLKNSPLIQLSSGEHKRFQLAKALVNPPRLLILDTPYTGLDVAGVTELNKLLNKISGKGTQIILIPGTFPIPEFITQVGFLKNKKLAWFGYKEEFIVEEFHNSSDIVNYNPGMLPLSDPLIQFESIVEMKDIQLNYGTHTIFKGLNWKVNEGEKWLLRGRNGSGKSSLLSMITGDHPQAYANEIYLFGKRRGSGESIWDIKQKTGFISPELHAYFNKNVSCFDAIGSGFFDTIGLYTQPTDFHKNIVSQWLELIHLSPLKNKPFKTLSLGQQRLALIVRAVLKHPPLLILDEAVEGLDDENVAMVAQLITLLSQQPNMAILYVSHRIEPNIIPNAIYELTLNENGSRGKIRT